LGTDEVGVFLRGLYRASVEGVAPLHGGEWSAAFSFTLGGQELVARFSSHREDFEKDRVASTFATSHLPVPRLLDIGESALGHYAITERKHGVFLEDLDERGWRRVLPELLATLDSMRLSGPGQGSGVELADDGAKAVSWREYLLGGIKDIPGGRVSGWRKKLSDSAGLEAVFSKGEVALGTMLELVPEIRCLVHGDLINRNVLVDPHRFEIVAVFDWGCGAFGDHLYDVAWLDFWAPWFPALQAVDPLVAVRSHFESIGHEVCDFDARIKAYEMHIALTHLAYNAFIGRDDEQMGLCARVHELLDGR
jgi:hygromycin-B 4-O-kinase